MEGDIHLYDLECGINAKNAFTGYYENINIIIINKIRSLSPGVKGVKTEACSVYYTVAIKKHLAEYKKVCCRYATGS